MKDLVVIAEKIRKEVIKIGLNSKSSVHYGGSLSIVEILTCLYFGVMNYDFSDAENKNRDRFVLSKGHGVLGQIATLKFGGLISDVMAESFLQDGGLSAHPVKDVSKGFEVSSGSLGQGLPFGIGVATALSRKVSHGKPPRVYVLIGDGEANEGSIWESFIICAKLKLANLTIIIDKNGFQNDGSVALSGGHLDFKKILEGFGFAVYEGDGHDFSFLSSTFNKCCLESNKTQVVVCNTIKGKGVEFMENNNDWHHNLLTSKMLREVY